MDTSTSSSSTDTSIATIGEVTREARREAGTTGLSKAILPSG
jgi:hypothetical protein